MEHLESPVFSTGEVEKIEIKTTIEKIKSHFQEIEIINTPKFGKCLVIDGLVQTGETDHELYDQAILKLLSKKDEQIFILGGGDGYVAEMGLKINPDVRITVVELDIDVVKACEKHLGQKVFYHPSVKLMAGDAFHFLKVHDELEHPKVDGIVCDLTDNPVGGRETEEQFRNFYENVFSLAKKIIRPGGWISVQAGASKVTGNYLNAVEILEKLMRERFFEVSREDVLIPSYSESEAFLYGRNK